MNRKLTTTTVVISLILVFLMMTGIAIYSFRDTLKYKASNELPSDYITGYSNNSTNYDPQNTGKETGQEFIGQKHSELPLNSVAIIYLNSSKQLNIDASYEVRWNIPGISYPVSINAIAQDYGEEYPSYCKVFFGSEIVNPVAGRYFLKIPKDACPGRYKVQVCKYNKENFEASECYKNDDYFTIIDKPGLSCNYPDANTGWGDGLYGCSVGSGQDQQRCYQGSCKTCDGLLAYDQGAEKLGCFYLADPGTSCQQFCGEKGSVADHWEDSKTCDIAKALTGCTSCSTNYGNGYLIPYYDISKNTCYRNLGAGVYYTNNAKPEYSNIQRACVCNY